MKSILRLYIIIFIGCAITALAVLLQADEPMLALLYAILISFGAVACAWMDKMLDKE